MEIVRSVRHDVPPRPFLNAVDSVDLLIRIHKHPLGPSNLSRGAPVGPVGVIVKTPGSWLVVDVA